MTLWAVGLCKSGSFPNVVWELVGVFSAQNKAEAVCKDHRYCVMPIELDEDYGADPIFSGEDYFPTGTN
jgi:hypothetical protein